MFTIVYPKLFPLRETPLAGVHRRYATHQEGLGLWKCMISTGVTTQTSNMYIQDRRIHIHTHACIFLLPPLVCTHAYTNTPLQLHISHLTPLVPPAHFQLSIPCTILLCHPRFVIKHPARSPSRAPPRLWLVLENIILPLSLPPSVPLSSSLHIPLYLRLQPSLQCPPLPELSARLAWGAGLQGQAG